MGSGNHATIPLAAPPPPPHPPPPTPTANGAWVPPPLRTGWGIRRGRAHVGHILWEPYVVEWHRRDRDGERQLTWDQFVLWMDDVEPLMAAATVRPTDHHPLLPPTHLAASAAASAAAEFRPVERGSVAVQLYTQVAKVAAQQKQQDKQDKYRRERAASLEKLRTSGEADKLLQRAGINSIGEQLRKQQQEEVDRVARAERWVLNRGLAAESVPCLPADLWALIFRHRKVEREQSRAWVEWADRKLMQLVAIWFRTGGQRSSKWLGTLMGKNGGISFASTDAMEDRFRPWCNAILRPGEENSPVHFAGAEGAPARFVDVYVHMLSMMNYAGFHDVIGRLKKILRTFARCLQPGSNVPKYIPGPPDSEDESDTWTAEVPEPGVQPPRPTEKYVTPVFRGEQHLPRAARMLQHQYHQSIQYRREAVTENGGQ